MDDGVRFIRVPKKKPSYHKCPICQRQAESQLEDVPVEDKGYTGPVTTYTCDNCNAGFGVAMTTGEILWVSKGGE